MTGVWRRSRSSERRWSGSVLITGCLWLFVLAAAPISAAQSTDELPRYFRQLRERGLFVVAEHYATQRLQAETLAPEVRTELVIELAQTYAEHAAYASLQQRDELWERSLQVLADGQKRQPDQQLWLQSQAALIAAARVADLSHDLLVAPEDGPLRERIQQAAGAAQKLLEAQIKELEGSLTRPRSGTTAPAAFQIRGILSRLRVALGDVLRYRAALPNRPAVQQAGDLVDATTAYRQAQSGTSDLHNLTRARVGLADVLRQQQNFPKAQQECAELAKDSTPPELRDDVEVCRVRCWLDQQEPMRAAEHLLALRQKQHVLSGELWFFQLETLLQLRDVAQQRKDEALVQQLRAEAELALTRVAEQAGGAWARRCQQLWERDQSRQQRGPDVDRLIRAAQADYLGDQKQQAVQAYAAAAQAAAAAQLVDLSRELKYTQGSILLELGDHVAAADLFSQMASAVPTDARTPAAHLLWAFALGRLYDEQRTQARRVAYTQALEAHLQKFPEDVTAGDASFMLAQLEEQRLQASRALPLYLAVPASHARSLEALAGAARCYEALIKRLKTLGRNAVPVQTAAESELAQRTAAWRSEPAGWTATQAEIAVRLARIQLLAEPARYAAAAEVLSQFLAALAITPEAKSPGWQRWDHEAIPLRIVALAGIGRSVEARELITQPSVTDPTRGLAVILGLDQLARQPASEQFVDLTELLVSAIRQLEPNRSHLSAAEQAQFDFVQVRAYLVTGRTDEGVTVAARLAEQWTQQPDRLLELAELLSSVKTAPAQRTALPLWQRLEQLEPAGSTAWLTARAAVIESLWFLGEYAEAAKRLKLTQLLYPKIQDPELQQRFRTLAEQITPVR